MKTLISILVFFALLNSSAALAAVYKCKTPEGITFSQTPCGDNAVKMKNIKSRSTARSSDEPPSDSGGRESFLLPTGKASSSVDIKKFERLPFTQQEIIERVGHPSARYIHNGTEHWLYANAVKINDDQQRVCPELLFDKGTYFQTTWHPEDKMNKAVPIVRGFGNWTPPAVVKDKPYYVLGNEVVGLSKDQLVNKLGQPDSKKVFDGMEWWEYKKVPISKERPQKITMYIEFKGDTVISMAGN